MNVFVTRRAFFTGVICCILIAFMAQYSVNVTKSSYMAIDHVPVAAMFIFFLLALLINPLFKRLRAAWSFSSGELLLVFIMMMVASSVTEMGLGSQLLQVISGAQYYANSENNWATRIFPYLKRWMVPQDKQAVQFFYEGLPKGGHIPWGAWAAPLAAWLPYLFTLYFVVICLMVLLRKQWVEREKLIYPLTVLPMEMAKDPELRGVIPAFFRNPLTWLGFSIPFIILSINALHFYFNMVPFIRLNPEGLPIFRRTMTLAFYTSLPVIGFVYLVNLEVSFSLWFFALLFQVIQGVFNITGVESTENIGIYGSAGHAIFAHVGFGAMVALTAYMFIRSRDHLRVVWSNALGRTAVDDRDEILSYKTAFWGLIIGIILMAVWLCFSGMNPMVAVTFVVCLLLVFLVLTRVICEAGIPVLITPIIASSVVISIFGSRAIGPAGMVALALTYVYSADIRTFVMTPVAQSLKIAEPQRGNKRLLFWAIMAALVVNIAATLAIVFHLAYSQGGINLNGWYFTGTATAPYQYAADLIRNPTSSNALGWLCRAVGSIIMVLLLFMRQQFLWWPLHPIGFMVGMVQWIQLLWFSIFIAWLLKTIILRYGGVRVYERLKFFFLGLPLGTYTAAGIWFIVDLFTHKPGNGIFWM